jgi:hypothetical protein
MAQGTHKGHHEPCAPIGPRIIEPRTSTTPPQASQIDHGTCLLHKIHRRIRWTNKGGEMEGRALVRDVPHAYPELADGNVQQRDADFRVARRLRERRDAHAHDRLAVVAAVCVYARCTAEPR